jgi:putative hemolysin
MNPTRTARSSWTARTLVALVAVGSAVLAGCSDDDGDEPTDTTVQLANPASVFCVEQGGTLEIVTEGDGEVGYCTLPDGTRIEEWAYFQQMTGGTQP